MSGQQVDVLGILDHYAEAFADAGDADRSAQALELREARAAVAGLIEAQRNANRSARLMHDDRQQEVVCIPPAEWQAVRAALNRVQGGAA